MPEVNQIETAQEFADALTSIAEHAAEGDAFRAHAVNDPEWAISEVTGGKTLMEGVELVISGCIAGEDYRLDPWPGAYPEQGTYDIYLPAGPAPLAPGCFARLSWAEPCSCPPFTMC